MTTQEEFVLLSRKIWCMTPDEAKEKFDAKFPGCELDISSAQSAQSALYVQMRYQGETYSATIRPEDAYKR